MSIQLMKINGKTGAVATCDVCGERVLDAGLAWVMWPGHALTEGDKTGTFLVVHKGKCLDQAETENPDLSASAELNTFYYQLLANTGGDVQQIEEAAKVLGSIDP